MSYEIELFKMSCVNNTDSDSTKRRKVKVMWEQYKLLFTCESNGFMVKDGNILKLSVHANFTAFLDGLVKDFDIDINYIDPADGKNVLDFTKDEIDRLTNEKNQPERLAELNQMYKHLTGYLKAKHSPGYIKALK
jgi:hypothetical protein